MANNTLAVMAGGWTELTATDVTGTITFQVVGNDDVLVMASAGSVEPASSLGALRYFPNQGEMGADLAEMFPGVAGANRLWAYATDPSLVAVSYA